MRDQETGYYSAGIIDLDGNSIEAMHREREKVTSAKTESIADDKRVLDWQKNVAKSTIGRGSESNKTTARIIINNVTAPTMAVSRSTAQIKDDGDMSAKQLIGTLLGAAAGAAVAYAMTKGEAENLRSPITQTITYQTVDAAESQRGQSSVSSRKSSRPATASQVSRKTLREIDYPQAPMPTSGHSVLSHHSSQPKYLEGPKAGSGQNLASTLIETFIPPSEVPRFPPHAVARSHTDSIIQRSTIASQDADKASQHSKRSRASSSTKTVTLKDFAPIARSSTGTEMRLARDAPLPTSRVGSTASRNTEPAEAPDQGLRSELGSVAPSDSISQAGPRRSKTSRRSSRHGHSKVGKAEVQDENSTHVSRETARYRGSKPEVKKDSVVSLPMRPSSKTSAHRSVKSFLHGM